jgi:hypothetical protein
MIRNLSMEAYQALPALSAGGIITLSEQCPALYWAQSPFNPGALPRKNSKEFDIGTAAHLAVLEPLAYADRVFLIPFDTYHKAEAREQRDFAYQNNQIPLKPAEAQIVADINCAIQRRSDIASLFRGGRAEITVQWEMDGVACKCRPDYVAEDYILDLKTVACAHPRAIAQAAMRDGWHVRDVWYREGIAANRVPELPPTRAVMEPWWKYLFVCVEKVPPYLVEVYQLDQRARAWGEQIVRRGLTLFKTCHDAGRWPSYHDHFPVTVSLPTYAEYALADREAAGDFEVAVP